MSYLNLTGIQKRFAGGVVAVRDFALAMEKGEFVSFLGPSGCGKTTTLRMIAGFEQPTTGRIVLDGTDITDRPPNRRNIGMVFQAYALFPNMTVADNIGFGLKVRKRDKASIARRTTELLGLIGTAQIRRIPRRNWTLTHTADAMVPIGAVPSVNGDADLWSALEVLERTGLDAILVAAGAPGALMTRRSAAKLVHEKAEERARELLARGPTRKGPFGGR